MKISIEIDCTAKEARELMGLPDIKPLQEKWLAEMEEKMLSDMDRFSPDALVKTWLSGSSGKTDWLQSLFETMSRQGFNQKKDKTD